MVTVNRGDVVLCRFDPVIGSEQAGTRPAIVVQMDKANTASPHTIIVPCTTRFRTTLLSSHVALDAGMGGLQQDSVVLCEQIRVIDRRRIVSIWGSLDEAEMQKIDQALRTILSLVQNG